MSLELLFRLQREHAFDPAPVREDLGVYHVPFADLVGDSHPERALLDACLRFERVALVGDSGTGKSSMVASVLGPLTGGVAPIVVPVARESFDVVREPRAMFAHLVSVVTAHAREAAVLSEEDREKALARVTAHRPLGRTPARSARVSVGWMGAALAGELVRQAPQEQSLARSATETLEVVHQMVELVRAESLVPVLVFDDTDRWLSGSAFREPERLVASFFGRVLHELADLRCALVVAVHRRYLDDQGTRRDVRRTLETRIEVPPLTSAVAIGKVLGSRVRAHAPRRGRGPGVDDALSAAAVERLFAHYSGGLRSELRGVLRTAHTALAAACDSRAEVITPELVDDAVAAWEG